MILAHMGCWKRDAARAHVAGDARVPRRSFNVAPADAADYFGVADAVTRRARSEKPPGAGEVMLVPSMPRAPVPRREGG